MKIVIQRVKEASVKVDEKVVGKIGKGILVFLGACVGDNEKDISYLSNKLINLRMFEDEAGKMNLSLKDFLEGEVLVVSQFTLYADCKKGRRPSFINALEPKKAERFYLRFIEEVKGQVKKVESGVFGAKMEVFLVNDGPVTFIIESKG
jgi:D-tyrosyl-tRNA(Tyr) deacylase